MSDKRPRGRPPGSPNKATRAIKEAASEYSEKALRALVEIMDGSEHPAAARVSAANAILDRAHGKPAQAIIGGDDGDPPIRVGRIELVAVSPKALPSPDDYRKD